MQIKDHGDSSFNWSKTAQILQKNYLFSVGERPNSVEIPLFQNIALIDLSSGQSQIQKAQEILDACQEYGLFQVRSCYLVKLNKNHKNYL